MNKRKLESESIDNRPPKKVKEPANLKKNSLDSDEEDDLVDEADYRLNEDDIEGEEDGVAGNYGEVRTTAFNMREELEEGHFDKNGHYIWNKEKEIKDNWLDNIDWQVIKSRPDKDDNNTAKGLGEESDSDEEQPVKTSEVIAWYKEMITYMEPKENVGQSLRRHGRKIKPLSSMQRLLMKKAGVPVDNEKVIKMTELANNILYQTGNMDVYYESYEEILKMIQDKENPKVQKESETLDMYSEDFDDKEKKRLDMPGSSSIKQEGFKRENAPMWHFKWTQSSQDIEGPFSTDQMQKWVDDGRFKKGIWVRRSDQDQFYSSARIDFELYLS